MPSRRAHTKSRLGCIQCKARRVKCDQGFPRCKNCERHEKTCVYGQVVKSATPNAASKATNGASPGSEVPAPVASPSSGPLFDALDMRLMHYFSVATAASLSLSVGAQETWKHVVPEKAMKHHMLMYGLLTLAAHHYVHCHKATTDSVTLHNYRTRALHHQHLGLQMFRHHVQSPSDDQPHAILLTFAAMLGMLTFADVANEQESLTFDSALNIIAVIRGKQALWRAGSGLSPESDLAPIFFDPPAADKMADFSDTALALTQLHDAADDDVRRDSIALLRSVAESKASSEFRMLGLWPAGQSDEHVQLLHAKDSVALQVFEHYCTIFDSMRPLWWAGDCGQKLRGAIREAATACLKTEAV